MNPPDLNINKNYIKVVPLVRLPGTSYLAPGKLNV